MSLYANGHSSPTADTLLRILDTAGVQLDVRPGRVDAARTVRAIDEDYRDRPSDAMRWLLQGRDHLLEMDLFEADLKWGDPAQLPAEIGWATILQVVIGGAFRQLGYPAPGWAAAQPLPGPWQPLTRLPIRPTDKLDPDLSAVNIRVRARDLVTV